MWQFDDDLELAEMELRAEEEEEQIEEHDDRAAKFAVRELMRIGISKADAESVIYGW